MGQVQRQTPGPDIKFLERVEFRVDADQAIRMDVRKRAEGTAFHDTEDCRGSANSERQANDGGGGEARRVSQHPHSVSQVLAESAP